MSRNQGFTLIETLVVIALVTIFLTLCVHGYFGLVARQRIKNTTSQMKVIIDAVKRFKLRNGAYATVNNLSDIDSINTEYQLTIKADKFAFSINFDHLNEKFTITATLINDMAVGIGQVLKSDDIPPHTITYTYFTNQDANPWGGDLLNYK